MKRCWIAALTAALVASACGTRVPDEERAARRAALAGSGVVESTGTAGLTPDSEGAAPRDPAPRPDRCRGGESCRTGRIGWRRWPVGGAGDELRWGRRRRRFGVVARRGSDERHGSRCPPPV